MWPVPSPCKRIRPGLPVALRQHNHGIVDGFVFKNVLGIVAVAQLTLAETQLPQFVIQLAIGNAGCHGPGLRLVGFKGNTSQGPRVGVAPSLPHPQTAADAASPR